MTKRRVFLVVMDSVGIGGAHDAATFGDEGSNTVGHIVEFMRAHSNFGLPNLAKMGLGTALEIATGQNFPELNAEMQGVAAAAVEHSMGKDTPSGHWEIAGLPVPWDWHYFPNEIPCFPQDLLNRIQIKTGVEFIGLKHASGTAIVDELGAEHVKTGKPIAYSSVDSVFQIAAHEEIFGLESLYQLCKEVAEFVHPLKVGRVIARPFIGDNGDFQRTANRHDYAIAPPSPTMLDRAQAAGHKTVSIGKISDIFSGSGIDESHVSMPDQQLFDVLDAQVRSAPSGALVFANFVEFDSLFGHRRDPLGYANALSWFDERLGQLMDELREDDLLIITADHGNDPTYKGNDHTRENVPALFYGRNIKPRNAGRIDFADIGATALHYLDVPLGPFGRTILES